MYQKRDMVFREKLWQLFQRAMREIYEVDVERKDFALQETAAEFEGTHTVVLFSLSKACKVPVAEIGHSLGSFFVRNSDYVASFNVVKGFLNLDFTDVAWHRVLQEYVEENVKAENPQRIIIEISCPNTNKPLHLGHLRNIFLGDAVANCLKFLGHDVKKLNHVNDRGIHICKSMYAYQQDPNASTPEATGKKGDHLVGDYYVRFDQAYRKEVTRLASQLGDISLAEREAPSMVGVQEMLRAWERGDEKVCALWRSMNSWVYQGFAETYRFLNITFDKSYYESEVYLLGKEMVQEGLAKGVFYKQEDGSVWVDLTEEQLGHKLLLRGDGTSVYMTQDLGTADLRYKDFEADRSIYVVGDEQAHHFAVLFAILRKLGRPYADHLFHLAYGMIDLPEGKMKSREGKVVDADGLIAEMLTIAKKQTEEVSKVEQFSTEELEKLYRVLAVGGLKFFLLKVSPPKRMCFDPKKSIDFLGCTAAFVQYCYARITRVLDRAGGDKGAMVSNVPLDFWEKRLVIQLVQLGDILREFARTLNPALGVQYMYTLAKTYNQFYAQLPILHDVNPTLRSRRLYLSWCTRRNLSSLAKILGIQMPKRM